MVHLPFKEFFPKFVAYAQHKRAMKSRAQKIKDPNDVELPELPDEEEVEKVGKEIKEEESDI